MMTPFRLVPGRPICDYALCLGQDDASIMSREVAHRKSTIIDWSKLGVPGKYRESRRGATTDSGPALTVLSSAGDRPTGQLIMSGCGVRETKNR